MNVLFLCTGNSARSQIAEAFLRYYGGDHFTTYSAGLAPSTVNPYTVQVMEELGFDLSEHRAKSVKEYLGGTNFAYVITVCAKAETNCPSTFPGRPIRLSWRFMIRPPSTVTMRPKGRSSGRCATRFGKRL